MSEQTPSISIDDALRLFLQLAHPGGLPDGQADALLEQMRARVAEDRPEWAAACAPPPEPTPPRTSEGSSRTKADIVTTAQASEVPTDPLERAAWEERQRARENAEQRRADTRDDETRERLRQQALADKRDVDETTLERALRIRRVLELKLQSLAPTHESIRISDSGQPAPAPTLANTSPAISSSSVAFTSDSTPEPTTVSFTTTERVELMRAYNAERRALLHVRENLIVARGLDHRRDNDERMRMTTEKPAPEPRSSLSMDSKPTRRQRTWDLQLDDSP